MSELKEVKLSEEKTYISTNPGFVMAILVDGVQKKFAFINGKLILKDPKDIELVDAEYEKRYLKKDEFGEPVLDEHGQKMYAGDIKFLPIDQYEKSRLSHPVLVKTKSGKTYQVTEADLIDLAEKKELGNENEGDDLVNALGEKEKQLNEKEQFLNEKEVELQAVDKALAEREKALNEKEQFLNEKEVELQAVDKALAEREKALKIKPETVKPVSKK